MELRDIVKQWLEANVYDGLYNSYLDCACEITDLMPCGNPSLECSAGTKTECDCKGEKHNFHIKVKETSGG